MKLNIKQIAFTLLLVALATLCKYICAPKLSMSGFSPIIAIALFSGMMVKEKGMSFLLPLFALVLSDVIIEVLYKMGKFDFAGFYSHQWINYGLILLCTLVGWKLKSQKTSSIFLGGIVGATLFFLLSNFSVWAGDVHGTYAKSIAGLGECLVAGLPFYKNSLIATLVFLPLVLMAYNFLVKQKTAFKLA